MSEARLPIHPYAELFPPMASPEFDCLCGDILQNGLQEDIVVHEGQVLEGRHRYLACLAKQVRPRFRAYAGECGSPLDFVVAKNLHRRHLSENQRSLVGARLRPLFEEQARQRQQAGLKRGSESPVRQNSAAREKHDEKATSAQKAAEVMKVSHFSVKAADKVRKKGVPQLVDALASDKIAVSAAARIAALPEEQQRAVVTGIESASNSNRPSPRFRPSSRPARVPAWTMTAGLSPRHCFLPSGSVRHSGRCAGVSRP